MDTQLLLSAMVMIISLLWSMGTMVAGAGVNQEQGRLNLTTIQNGTNTIYNK
jgi:hypothetical protein